MTTQGATHRNPIKVLIVDDQAMVRSGLRYVLMALDDMELVGEAANLEEALEVCAQVEPDVVLMDMSRPGIDAASAVRALHERHPHTHIIAMSGFWALERVQEVMEAGATSSLLKNVSAEELAGAIRAAHLTARGSTHAP